MGRNVFRLAIAALISAGALGSMRGYSQAVKSVTISVLLLDYSGIAPSVLADAERKVSEIYGPTGIYFSWINCPTRPSPDSSPICADRHGPEQLSVRVLRRHPSHYLKDSIYGIAMPPYLVTVYFESAQLLVESMTTSPKFYISTILGCLIAHELGHLLLGENQHAAGGIMQAQWDLKQIQRALQSTLGFTPQQAVRMRANAHERINSSLASLSAGTK